jgi:hypothetical protein
LFSRFSTTPTLFEPNSFASSKSFLSKNGYLIVNHTLSVPFCDFTSFSSLYNYFTLKADDPRICLRGIVDNVDSGMIDITNPTGFIADEISPVYLAKLPSLVTSYRSTVDSILSAFGASFSHSSLYLYKNVDTPRCLHCDTLRKPLFKAFILLTPVSYADGPYAVIPGSHRSYFRKYFSLLANIFSNSDLGTDNYDMTLFSSDESLLLLGLPGFSFITDQSAVHGDLPCISSSYKASLVLNYSS